MDPKVRRKVWGLIEQIKQTRAVILTTHSMEEADILSDRVAVIKDGSLRCIGTASELKNRFGDGYRVSLSVEEGDSNKVFELVKKMVPKVTLVDSSGGSLICGIRAFEDVVHFLKQMEAVPLKGSEMAELKGRIKDWGVSDCSLEEVFINVTKM